MSLDRAPFEPTRPLERPQPGLGGSAPRSGPGRILPIVSGMGLLLGTSALAPRLPLGNATWLVLLILSATGLAWSWRLRDKPAAAASTEAAAATAPCETPCGDPTPPVPAPPPPSPAPTLAAAPMAPSPIAVAETEEREAMMYAVSHDLRAPIRVIEGFTRIVQEDYGHSLDRVGKDHLERVLGAAARMNGMIDSLLALSHLSSQPLERRPVDLSAMAAEILDELALPHPERMAEVRVQPGLLVDGDPTLLRRLMENLLANAWKYSARRARTCIEFGVVKESDEMRYFVRDNGAGFDMRFANRLFGAFQRLHSASEYSGTGVGLASAQRIVRRHGGRIWAESAVDEGATFYFTLQGPPH